MEDREMCKNYQEIKAMKESERQIYLYETSEYGIPFFNIEAIL